MLSYVDVESEQEHRDFYQGVSSQITNAQLANGMQHWPLSLGQLMLGIPKLSLLWQADAELIANCFNQEFHRIELIRRFDMRCKMSFLKRKRYGMFARAKITILIAMTANPPKSKSQTELVIESPCLPALIFEAGEQARERFVEFFTASIRNRGTRAVYANAVHQFMQWCSIQSIGLVEIKPIVVAAYIEQLTHQLQAPTVKVHLAAIRSLFDFLVTGHIVMTNPAASVRGPAHSVKKGSTPVLAADEARQLLDSIDLTKIAGLRDRAIIGVMVFSFARVSATIGMNIGEYFMQRRKRWFRLHEKGGKRHDVPAHHNAVEYVEDYLDAAGIREESKGPLFRSLNRYRQLSLNRMHRNDVLRMIKRRAAKAELPTHIGCHTFRATGITAYLSNQGSIEHAQKIANHDSIRSTKLYDRTSDEPSLDEIEKIQI